MDNSRRTHHTALIDCELLAKVYINLIDQKEPTLDFQQGEKTNYSLDKSQKMYFKGLVKPTEVELEKHKNYLKSHLKKNFF